MGNPSVLGCNMGCDMGYNNDNERERDVYVYIYNMGIEYGIY